MKKRSIKMLLGIVINVMATLISAQASLLISESFTNVSSLNVAGWYFYQSSSAGSAWRTATDSTTPLSGTVLLHPTGSAAYTKAIRQFPSTTLNNVGDAITLTFDFKTSSMESTGAQLTVRLLNSATTITSNSFGGSDPINDANGYQYYQPISTNSSPTTPTVGKIANDVLSATLCGASAVNISDATVHSLRLTLTLLPNGVEIRTYIDGKLCNSYIDISCSYTTFNTLTISGGTNITEFDNIVLQTSTLIFDNFSNLTNLNAAGWYFYQNSSSGAAWSTVSDSAAPLSGTVLLHPTGSAAYTKAIRQFPSTTLNNVGDAITLTFDFKTSSVESTGAQLTVRLLSSATTVAGNTFGSSDPINDANGYQYYQLISTNSSPTTPTVGKIANDVLGTTLCGASVANISDAYVHSLKLTLTLLSNGVEIKTYIDGSLYNSFVDTSNIYATFNTLTIDCGTNVTEFDNISCTVSNKIRYSKYTTNTILLRNAKYGVFVHYLNGLQNKSSNVLSQGLTTSWDAAVNSFNVDTFANQLAQAGVGYVIFTLQQCDKYMCAPNLTYNTYTGYSTGQACSTRDLINDLHAALSPYGIKLFIYVTGDGPHNDTAAAMGLGWTGTINSTYLSRWGAVIAEYSNRYGANISGWWTDGCYYSYGYDDASIASLADNEHAGNPGSILAFNRGVIPIGSFDYLSDDYTAGERDSFDQICSGAWVNGYQWHILSYIGPSWATPGTEFTVQSMLDFITPVVNNGGAVTMAIAVYRDGTIDGMQLNQLNAINNSLNKGANYSLVSIGKNASASSTCSSLYLATNGNDDSKTTIWASGADTDDAVPYWQVDLGAAYYIRHLEMIPRQDLDEPSTRRNFQVWASNDPTFSTYDMIASQGAGAFSYLTIWNAVAASSTSYRYVRVVRTANSSDYHMNFSEFRVYGSLN